MPEVGGKSGFGFTSVQSWELENEYSSTKPLNYLEASGCLSAQYLKVILGITVHYVTSQSLHCCPLTSRFFRVLMCFIVISKICQEGKSSVEEMSS